MVFPTLIRPLLPPPPFTASLLPLSPVPDQPIPLDPLPVHDRYRSIDLSHNSPKTTPSLILCSLRESLSSHGTLPGSVAPKVSISVIHPGRKSVPLARISGSSSFLPHPFLLNFKFIISSSSSSSKYEIIQPSHVRIILPRRRRRYRQ